MKISKHVMWSAYGFLFGMLFTVTLFFGAYFYYDSPENHVLYLIVKPGSLSNRL